MKFNISEVSSFYSFLWYNGFVFAAALFAAAFFVYKSVRSRNVDSLPAFFIYIMVMIWLSKPVAGSDEVLLPRVLNYCDTVARIISNSFNNMLGVDSKRPYESLETIYFVNNANVSSAPLVSRIEKLKSDCFLPQLMISGNGFSGAEMLSVDFYDSPLTRGCRSVAGGIGTDLLREVTQDRYHNKVITKIAGAGHNEVGSMKKYIEYLAKKSSGVRHEDGNINRLYRLIRLSESAYDVILYVAMFSVIFLLLYSFIPYKYTGLLLLLGMIILVRLFHFPYYLIDVENERIISFLDGKSFTTYDVYFRVIYINSVWIVLAVVGLSLLYSRLKSV